MNKRIITSEEKYRDEMEKLYEKAKNKVWDFHIKDFKIDKNFNFTHKTWCGTYCKGGNSRRETIKLINKYINESKKPWMQRNLSWLHLV